MKLTGSLYLLIGFYIALLLFWLATSLFVTDGSPINILSIFDGFKHSTQFGYIFAFSYAFVPFFGSIVGFKITKSWGFFKYTVGKAVFFFSLSLFSWAIGEFIWAYYNLFLNATVPYPSLADVGFVCNYPFFGVGLIYLGKASGAGLGLHKTSRKLLLVVIPIIVSVVSWYIMVVVARGGSITSGGGALKVFFDIAYPAGDVILLTMGLLIFGLSFRYWGPQLKWPITILLLGILTEYIADFGFSYTTTVNTFYNGGWVDLLYTTSLMIISIGVILLDNNGTHQIESVTQPSSIPVSPLPTTSPQPAVLPSLDQKQESIS